MQVQIFEFQNYKEFVQAWVEQLPKAGHGFYRKMAINLNVSTTLLSQIFKGDKQISLELAYEVAIYLGLNNKETEFFILLVEYGKAGSHRLQELFLKKIKRIQKEHKQLDKRLERDIEPSEITKSIFYSDWLYSGIRNLIAIEEYSDINRLAIRLNISPQKMREVIDFLVKNNFCARIDNRLKIGPQKTFVAIDSPWVQQHHQNWRIKAIEKMPMKQSQNIFYTGPMSMSEKIAEKIRDEIPEIIQRIYDWVGPSTSETVRCLNLDWFEY
jgi:uncharacterized protein (TIGR02147 family)